MNEIFNFAIASVQKNSYYCNRDWRNLIGQKVTGRIMGHVYRKFRVIDGNLGNPDFLERPMINAIVNSVE